MGILRSVWPPRVRKQALDLGLYGHSDYARFIVLGRSRVGSNLLRGLLNAHPAIEAYGEIFRDSACLDWDHTGYFQSPAMRSLVQQNPVRFVGERVLGRYPSGTDAVGFKLFYYHARDGVQASVWPFLQQQKDLKVIHLKRRNLLQTHLSRKRAALSDRWVNTSAHADDLSAIQLDYDACLEDFVQTRTWEEEADRYFAGHPSLEVHYESLAADYRAETHRIQTFLGVEPHPVAPSTFQQARQPLSAMIANYTELRARFRGTAWEQFFTD